MGKWVEARSLEAGDLLQTKTGDYITIVGIENLPHYEKVYNFDVQDNENYYVTEDGILVHNGYGGDDGDLLESDIAKALDEAGIPYEPGNKFGPNGSIGEIDFETANDIIEATVRRTGKLSQIEKLINNTTMNPNGKPVILVGPNYKNSAAVRAIEDAGAKVVHSIEDLLKLIQTK